MAYASHWDKTLSPKFKCEYSEHWRYKVPSVQALLANIKCYISASIEKDLPEQEDKIQKKGKLDTFLSPLVLCLGLY